MLGVQLRWHGWTVLYKLRIYLDNRNLEIIKVTFYPGTMWAKPRAEACYDCQWRPNVSYGEVADGL